MPTKLKALLLGQLVNAPVAMLLHFHQSMRFQVAEMFGDIDLRLLEHRLEVTDTKRGLREQMQDAQPRLVAKALVNLDQLHADNMPYQAYSSK